MSADQTPEAAPRWVDGPSHLAGQLAGSVDLAGRLEGALVAVGGPMGRALLRIVAEQFTAAEWVGLHPVEEQLRVQVLDHLQRRAEALGDDTPGPGGYL